MRLTQQMYIAPHDGTIYREVADRDFYLSSDGHMFYPWEAIEVALQEGILVPFDPDVHSTENIPTFKRHYQTEIAQSFVVNQYSEAKEIVDNLI